MTTPELDTSQGSIAIPEAGSRFPSTPTEELDAALATLADRAAVWTAVGVERRIELLDELVASTLAAAPAWCLRASEVKGIRRDSPLMGEEWVSGPLLIVRFINQLERTLRDVQRTGRPQPPAVTERPDGRVAVQVMPATRTDRLLLPGVTAETWLEPGVSVDDVLARMGRIYRGGYTPDPAVALVLGAGNFPAIAPTDALYQLFALDRVVILKMNPANDHLGPHLAEAFEPLVRDGFLRIAYGGADVGEYLVEHDAVDAIHLTGSDKTHDAVRYGTGEEGERRRAAGTPRIDKEVTAELGNVTPVIVVPGPWSSSDLTYHGHALASMLLQNAGFNCVALRMIVQHRAWSKRRPLLNAVRDSLRKAEPRVPYYPGALERWQRFTDTYRQAERFGPSGEDRLPFTLIPEIDPDNDDDLALTTESFCAVLGEVGLDTPRSVPEYLDEAVAFCNERVSGSLAAMILVHPRSLKDPAIAAAVERAVADLRYGVVAVNDFAGTAFGTMYVPWGAYGGAEPRDRQSGSGFVHNTFLLEDVEKSVVRGPFRSATKPLWFHTHRTLDALGPRLVRYVADEDPTLLPGIVWSAVRA